MARPSKWRLSPAARINLPTVLVAPFEALAAAVDKNETEKAKSILDAVLEKYCDWPAPEPQEGTFTILAPAVPGKPSDPYEWSLEDDDEPLPETVLATAFQPETPRPETESDRQWLEQALVQSHDEAQPTTAATVPVVIAETTGTELAIEDKPFTATAGVTEDVASLETLASESEAVECPAVQAVATDPAAPEPVPSAGNLGAMADLLQLTKVFSWGTQGQAVEATPENSLATELAVDVEPQAVANGSESVTVADPVALTAAVTTATEAPERVAVAAVDAPSEVTPIATVEIDTERTERVAIAALETVTERTENGATVTPDLELAARQINPVTAAETDQQTALATATIDATPNESETAATAPLPMPLEDVEGFWQKLESPLVDAVNLPSAPVAFTTTSESVEVPADDATSFCQKLSTPTEAFLAKIELRQNVALGTVDQSATVEGFCQKLVEPEPPSDHAFVEPQNSHQKLTSEPVSVAATGLVLPVELDETAYIQAPLVFGKSSQADSIEFLPKIANTDTILTNGSPNGSVEQGLKMAEEHSESEPVVFDKNTLAVLGSNETTVPELLTAPQVLETFVEDANLTVEAATVTPTTPLPELPPPVDMVQELATFAALLFNTWQRLTLAKRGELSLCWGLHVTFDYLFREGFTHMTAYRFFVLLEALLQSETDYAYGCLQVSCDSKTEPVELSGRPFNRLTFYAPGTPKHERNAVALKQACGRVALQPTEGSEQELERIRQERQEHLAAVAQDKVKKKVQQSRTQRPGGVLRTLKQLTQRLLS